MRDKKKLILTVVGGLVLYLASAGISYATFRYLAGPLPGLVSPISPLAIEEGRSKIDLTAPKTEACPLNGNKFTVAERAIWEGRRPLTVMIENHQEARPQSGLSSADVVYEAVAEGAITRFLAVFYCGASAQDVIIGPVRSARIYYLDFASEYGDYPLYAHVGGANDFAGSGDTDPRARALEKIADLGWQRYNDIDYANISAGESSFEDGSLTFVRDTERLGHPVAWEHVLYSSTDKLWWIAQKRGLDATDDKGQKWDEDFVTWKFKDEAELDQRGQTGKIEFDFWSGYSEYSVKWQYDRQSNYYRRFNGGQAHRDLNNDEQLQAKTVVVQLVRETGPIDTNKHLLYDTTGKGKVLVFMDGQVAEGTWSKADRQSRTTFTDSKGKEISFNRGPIWIEIVPAGKEVTY